MNHSEPRDSVITAVVVTYESAQVLERCVASLARSAPRRGVRIVVVDNASRDGSAEMADRLLGASQVRRETTNQGFAAAVNRVARDFSGTWLAVINPDAEVPAGGLDALADVLDAHPRAGLVGPRVLTHAGVAERTVGYFPTLRRAWQQALWLHRLPGLRGRMARFPSRTAPVDWVSGCVWLLRGDAVRAAGPLCEEYFMYWEDVDYCRVLRNGGWDTLATPDVTVRHDAGTGSTGTALLPADGGLGLLRYFARFHPEVPPAAVRSVMRVSSALRQRGHAWCARCGSARSAVLARRYALTLDLLRGTAANASPAAHTQSEDA